MNFYFFDIIHFLVEKGAEEERRKRREKSEGRDDDDGVWIRRMREEGEEEVKNISTGQTIYHSEKSRNDVFMRCVTIKHWRGIMRENRVTEQERTGMWY